MQHTHCAAALPRKATRQIDSAATPAIIVTRQIFLDFKDREIKYKATNQNNSHTDHVGH